MEAIFTYLNFWLGKIAIPGPIPADKQAHAITGTILFLALWIIFGMGYAYLATFIIALTKEVYDHFHPESHVSDPWDAVATITIPTIIVILVKTL